MTEHEFKARGCSTGFDPFTPLRGSVICRSKQLFDSLGLKEIRGITGLGLAEAKGLVEGIPAKVKEGISKEDAEAIKAQLEAVGATIEIK